MLFEGPADREARVTAEARRMVAERSAFPVSVTDRTGRVIWANPVFCSLCGVDRAAVARQQIQHLLRLDDADAAAAQALLEGVARGEEQRWQVTGRGPGDRTLYLLVESRNVPQTVHGPGAMVLQWLDQTEHVLTSRRLNSVLSELTRERERLGYILAGTQVGGWEVNIVTGEARMDEAWANMFGYTRSELEPWSRAKILAMMHPDDEAPTTEQLARHVAGELPGMDIEHRVRHRDGRWIWVHSRGKVSTWTHDGRAEWLAGSHMDIQLRKQQEQAIEAQRAYVRTLLASLPGVVFEFELDEAGRLRCTFLSDALRAMFGLEPSAALADSALLFKTVPAEDMQSLYAAIDQSARRLGPLEHEYRVTTPGGQRWLGVHAQPQRRADGSLQWHGMLLDVTRRHELAEQLRQARAAAEEANRAKSAFLATMSHEIRSPMNGVLGMTDVLTSAASPEDQADAVQTIRESARSLLGLIDDILDFSKIEAGRLELERLALNPGQLTESIAESLANSSAAEGVTVTVRIAPSLPQLVWGDPTRLRQVLFNLISNAIKFSRGEGASTGQVRITVAPDPSPPGGLCLCIEDQGIGMDADTLERLFQPFNQADASTTRRFGGTGLGLAIVRRLVDAMQGKIEVDSQLGTGTRFSVWLPLELADAGPEATSHDLSALQCLLIGDDDEAHDRLARLLCHAGAACRRVASLDALQPEPERPDGPVVVLLSHTGAPPDPESLRPLRARTGADLRFLLLPTEGRPQPLRIIGRDVGIARPIRRQALLRAVATLGGLASPESQAAPSPFAPPIDDEGQALTREAARASGRLVLVVEDDLVNQKVAVRQLRLLGVFADIANEGQEALVRWRTGDYTLVFTDLHMPRMDGYSMVSALREEESRRGLARTPVLALTANALRGEERRARDAGMDDYLTKPIPLEALQAALQRWLGTPACTEPAGAAQGTTVRPSEAPLSNEAPLDLAALRRMVGDEDAVVVEFIDEYRRALGQLAAEIDEAFRENDLNHIADVAHRLKSSSRAVGAFPLARLCERLERLVQVTQGPSAQSSPVMLTREQVEFERHVEALGNALHLAHQEVCP
jgi:PAS domain S-box-containing protein